MPIYEYRCQSCDASFEKLYFPTEKEHPTCPKCGSGDVKKQLSTFGVHKGSSVKGSSAPADCGSCCGFDSCSNFKH